MDGYTVSEAASVLGVSTERVWELLARGVLAGTPEGPSGMVVFLQPRPGPMPTPSPSTQDAGDAGSGRQRGPNGHDGELSPFRELLTEFRNLTERYGQALLALGEARGEVASLRGRVELLEARIDLRLPPPQGVPPRRAAWEFAAPEEPEEAVDAKPSAVGAVPADVAPEASAPAEPELGTEAAAPTLAPPAPAKRPRRGEKAAKRRSPARTETRRRPALAEALARAEDPTLAGLPGGREAADALAALHATEAPAPAPAPETALPEALQPEVPTSAPSAPEALAPEALAPEALAPEALAPEALAPETLAPEEEMGAPWELPPASELPFAEEPIVAAAPEGEEGPATPMAELVPADVWAEEAAAAPTAEVQTVEEGDVAAPEAIPLGTEPAPAAVGEEMGGPDASVPVEIEAESEEPTAVWEEAEPGGEALPAGSPYTAQLEEPDWFSDADLASTGDQGYPVTEPMTAPEMPAPAWEMPQPPFAPPEVAGPMPEERSADTEPAAAALPEEMAGIDEAAEAPAFEAPAFEASEVEAAAPYAESQPSYGQEPQLAGDEMPEAPADAVSTTDEAPADQSATPAEEFWAYEQPAVTEAEWSGAAVSVFDSEPAAPSEPFEGAVDMPEALEAAGEPSTLDPSPGAAAEDLPEHDAELDRESWAYVEEALEPEAVVELTAPGGGADIDASPTAEVPTDRRAAEASVAPQWSSAPAASAEAEAAEAPEAAEAADATDAADAEEEVMWLGSPVEPAEYAEEMEVSTGSTGAAAAGFTPAAEPSSEREPSSDAPTTASLPDDIYVEGWTAAAPEASYKSPAASPAAVQPSTGSPELDEGLAALDALARMAAARRAVKSQPSTPTREPPLTGDEIVQRLRSQMAAQRGSEPARPAPDSTATPPPSAPARPASPPTQPAAPGQERMRDQRSPASRAYRRLRRIFPG